MWLVAPGWDNILTKQHWLGTEKNCPLLFMWFKAAAIPSLMLMYERADPNAPAGDDGCAARYCVVPENKLPAEGSNSYPSNRAVSQWKQTLRIGLRRESLHFILLGLHQLVAPGGTSSAPSGDTHYLKGPIAVAGQPQSQEKSSHATVMFAPVLSHALVSAIEERVKEHVVAGNLQQGEADALWAAIAGRYGRSILPLNADLEDPEARFCTR